jgi:hypothetical protein
MDSRTKTILLGTLLGAGTGLIAAMILNRRTTRDQRPTTITTGDGLRLGMLVVGLLRAIAALGEEEKQK